MSVRSPELAPRLAPPPASVLVSELIRAWPAQQPFSARRILQENPDWRQRESLVLDLASEEFFRRAAAGEAIRVTEFVQNYPALSSDLRRVILIDQLADSRHILEAQWPAEGDVIDRFHLREPLGRGAQSRVFLAEDESLDNRQVVLKFVPSGSSEAVLLARTEHSHVMPVLHVFPVETRGLTAICMPFVGRATLCHVTSALAQHAPRQRTTARLVDEFIAAGWMDPAQPRLQRLRKSSEHSVEFVVRLGIAIAEACSAANDRGVLHRDIKPSNVLMTFGAEPLLLDFNLSYAAGAAGCEGGTIPYMPPERLRAWLSDPATAPVETAASDVFSLGATLFEVLAGQPPFGLPEECGSRTELVTSMLARQQRGPLQLHIVNPCVNRSLARVLERSLELDPQLRPQSMNELAAELRSEFCVLPRCARAVRFRPTRTIGSATAAAALLTAAVPLSAWAWDYWGPRVHAAIPAVLAAGEIKSLEQLGLERLEAGEPGEALIQFRQAFDLQPTGRLAELAAVAALRERVIPATAQYFLERADKLGYSGVEHENNWAVCELRLGQIDTAHKRLTPLLDSAPKDAMPTVLLNWMEAELHQSRKAQRCPDVLKLRSALKSPAATPWHQLQAAKLYAQALATHHDPFERPSLLQEFYGAAQGAADGGVSRDTLKRIEGSYPQIAGDFSWQKVTRAASDESTVHDFEPTLIPR